MRDFNRRDGGRGGGRDFGRRDFDRPQQMHKAICSNCGKECEVPFKPTGSKPVFCRECFQNNRTGGGDNFQRRDFDDRRSQPARPTEQTNYNQQFENLNAKLDKTLSLLSVKEEVSPVATTVETVTEEKPVVKRKRVVKEIVQEETPTE